MKPCWKANSLYRVNSWIWFIIHGILITCWLMTGITADKPMYNLHSISTLTRSELVRKCLFIQHLQSKAKLALHKISFTTQHCLYSNSRQRVHKIKLVRRTEPRHRQHAKKIWWSLYMWFLRHACEQSDIQRNKQYIRQLPCRCGHWWVKQCNQQSQWWVDYHCCHSQYTSLRHCVLSCQPPAWKYLHQTWGRIALLYRQHSQHMLAYLDNINTLVSEYCNCTAPI